MPYSIDNRAMIAVLAAVVIASGYVQNSSTNLESDFDLGKYDPSRELALKISEFFDTEVEELFTLNK